MTYQGKQMDELTGVSEFTTISLMPKCAVCRKELITHPMELRTAHDECLDCPKCGSTFVVWQNRGEKSAILRCLNCLERWEGVDG